jgi:hypothetical protein
VKQRVEIEHLGSLFFTASLSLVERSTQIACHPHSEQTAIMKRPRRTEHAPNDHHLAIGRLTNTHHAFFVKRPTRAKGMLQAVLILGFFIYYLYPSTSRLDVPSSSTHTTTAINVYPHKPKILGPPPPGTISSSVVGKKNAIVYYSKARPDRSGAAIQDMLMCHAYAFARNATYGGACGEVTPYRKEQEYLISTIGLTTILPFACPTQESVTSNVSIIVDWTEYLLTKEDAAIWTPEWLQHIRQHIRYSYRPASSQNPKSKTPFTIAVHIRRGDVDPCCLPLRYLPNSHYLRLIEKYAATHTDARVVIFSESKSFEPLDVFSNKGYELILDGDVGEAWKTIMVADVIILSKSSFSYVPAVLSLQGNDNKTRVVVYTEFWHKPLPGWEMDDDIAHVKRQLRLEKKKMRKEQCTGEIISKCSVKEST